MPLLAVVPHRAFYGVEPPGASIKRRDGSGAVVLVEPATYDWRAAPLSAENTAPVEAVYQVRSLEDALLDTFTTEAHFVPYVLRCEGAPLRAQPRVNKGGLGWLIEQGFSVGIEFFVADVDNPGHAKWPSDEAAVAGARAVLAKIHTCGVYVTSGGLRVIQPIGHAIDVREVEPILRGWHLQLAAAGVLADPGCSDWTRHYRMPNIRRAGRPYRSPAILLDQMRPIPTPRSHGPSRGSRAHRRRTPVSVAYLNELPEAHRTIARRVALAIREAGGMKGERHALYLALAGAFLRRMVDPSLVPALVTEVAALAGSDDPLHHHRSAVDTVERWAQGLRVKGLRYLPEPVALAIEEQSEAARTEPTAPTATEAHESIVHAIRSAPLGLTLVHAQCGLGKTQAAITVAGERATVQGKPGAKRIPLHTKTAISVPTTELASQIVERLRSAGTPAMRVFGPLSVKRPDGSPECRFADAAKHLADGAQSIPWELCEGRGKSPCPHRSVCRAYGGREGPEEARVAVGPHGLLGQLDAFAGKTGLLVIDEPPQLVSSRAFTVAQLRAAEGQLSNFDARYAAALAPVLRAAIDWTETGPLDTPGPLSDVVKLGVDAGLHEMAFRATGATETTEQVRAAFTANHRGAKTPPIRSAYLWAARSSTAIAALLGSASRVLWTLYRGIVDPNQSTARIEARGEERVLVVTESNEDLRTAVTRDGATIALDANADLHKPVLEKVVGYGLTPHAAFAPDPVSVRRVHIRARASRSRWLRDRRFALIPSFVRHLGRAIDVVREYGAKKVAIVTMRTVEIGLRGVLGEDVSAEWKALRQSNLELSRLKQEAGPVLARLGVTPSVGHYGALRGLDHWRDYDALVTLGDPWPNLGEVQNECDFLGLADGWEERAAAMCRAELEQAHGRLRVPHRSRPCLMIHVGSVRPGGWSWDIETVRDEEPPGEDEERNVLESHEEDRAEVA